MIPNDVASAIAAVAHTVANQNPPVDADDISQALSLYYLGLTEKQRSVDLSLLKSHLYGEARSFAKRERAEWHRLSVHYYYAPEDVRSLLREMYAYPIEEIIDGFVPADAKSVDNPSMDALDLMFDVHNALDDISPEDANAIAWAYDGTRDRDMTPAEKKRASRAVGRLADQMNTLKGLRDKPAGDVVGTRRVVSSAQARAIIRGQD